MDGGAWRATVHGGAKRQTRRSDSHTHTHTHTQETAYQPPSLGSVLSRCPAEQGWVSLPFVTPLPGAVPGPQRAGRESPPVGCDDFGKKTTEVEGQGRTE